MEIKNFSLNKNFEKYNSFKSSYYLNSFKGNDNKNEQKPDDSKLLLSLYSLASIISPGFFMNKHSDLVIIIPNIYSADYEVNDFSSVEKIQRPDIKHHVILPKDCKKDFSQIECELFDYAVDEFSRVKDICYLSKLLDNEKGNPFKRMSYNLYYHILWAKYDNLRFTEYSINPEKDFDRISDITKESNDKVFVSASNGWHYRYVRKLYKDSYDQYMPKKITECFSLNFHAIPELIEKFDDYFENAGVRGFYKTPANIYGWLRRHDPIKIYINDKNIFGVEQEIAEIAAPYIRSTKNFLPGKVVIPGITVEQYPNSKMIKELVDEAKEVDIKLAVALLNFFGGDVKNLEIGNARASSGQFYVAQDLVDFIKSVYAKHNL